jgi:hypothetical protein
MNVLPMIGLAANIGGTAMSVGGQLAAGNAAKATADFNAQKTIEEANIQESQQRQQDLRTLSRAKAVVGSSGVEMSGSPLDVLAESARQAEMNALIIRRGGVLDAQSQEIAGKNAQTASRIGAAGTLLTGGYSIAKDIVGLNRGRATKPAVATPLPLTPNVGSSSVY